MATLNLKSSRLTFGIVGAISLFMLLAVLFIAQTSRRPDNLAINNQTDTAQVAPQNQTPTNPQPTADTISDNRYFTISLPAGWREDNSAYRGPSSAATFSYKNNSGARLTVLVNSAGFEGVGDGSAGFEVSGNRLKLDRGAKLCQPSADAPLCLGGDDQLKFFYTSAEKLMGNSYVLDMANSSTESLSALTEMVNIAETIQAK